MKAVHKKILLSHVLLLFSLALNAQTYDLGVGLGAYIIPSRQNKQYEMSRDGLMRSVKIGVQTLDVYKINGGVDYVQDLYDSNIGLIRVPISISCSASHFFRSIGFAPRRTFTPGANPVQNLVDYGVYNAQRILGVKYELEAGAAFAFATGSFEKIEQERRDRITYIITYTNRRFMPSLFVGNKFGVNIWRFELLCHISISCLPFGDNRVKVSTSNGDFCNRSYSHWAGCIAGELSFDLNSYGRNIIIF